MAIQENNHNCFGCGACENICPKNAILMVEDEETFLYPRIDSELCVNCGLCEKTCPIDYQIFFSNEKSRSYVGTYNSDDVIYNSSSGGAFTAIYEVYINKGYKIYGVQYGEHFKVTYGSAITIDDCTKFRKSKYIQSYYNGCYEKVAKDLKAGVSVLFSGVSCQCAALSLYLKTKGIDSSNLVIVNILCHGVPSQKMFDSYKEEEEAEEDSLINLFQFRNKKLRNNILNSRSAWVEFSNGHKYVRTIGNDAFVRGYYLRLFYRPSCYKCNFARKDRISDFTLCDAWNIENIKQGLNPLSGVSLILFNTDKAINIFDDISKKMMIEEVPSEWAFNSQKIFHYPTEMPKNRERFFYLWRKFGFKKAVFKCTKPTIRQRIGKIKKKLMALSR